MLKKRAALIAGPVLAMAFVLAACATGEIRTVVVTEIVQGEPVTQIIEVTAQAPEPVETDMPQHDTIIICMSQEPDSLHALNSNMAVTTQVWHAADPKGWYNDRGYFYETQMLVNNEFPSFDNGNAVIEGEGPEAVLSVTFRFKPEIVWSDGEPFTVDDLIYTREVLLDPESGAVSRGIYEQLMFEKVDDHTLTVIYPPGVQNPTFFLTPLSTVNDNSPPLPEHVLGEMSPNEILESEYPRLPNPVLGPYQFVEWVEGDRIVLEANPNWWGGDVQTPNLIYRIISDTNQLLASVLSGECDYATNDGLQLTQVPFIQQSADRGLIEYTAIPAVVWEHIDMNGCPAEGAEKDALPIFGDSRVRKAIAYGTNRLQMTEEILYGEVEPLTSYLPSDHWAWNPDTAGLYEYDPEQAAALLEEAGWVDSDGDGVREAAQDIVIECDCGFDTRTIPAGTVFEVSFHTTTGNAMREQLSAIFQSNMADIGIQVNIDLLPASVWFATEGPLYQRLYQIGEYAWVSDPDPDAWFIYGGANLYRTPDGRFVNGVDLWDEAEEELLGVGLSRDQFIWGRPTEEELPEGYLLLQNEMIPQPEDDHEGGNRLTWCNPAATQALFNGNNVINPEDRLPYYLEFQEYLVEDLPTVPLFQRLNVEANVPGLCGPDVGPANFASWNVETWYFGDCDE